MIPASWLPWLVVVLVYVATFSALRAKYANGKAAAFREVADTWYRLKGLALLDTSERRDYTQKERQAAFLRLALCDPRVREAMWEGLREADAFWSRQGDLPSELAHPREEATT